MRKRNILKFAISIVEVFYCNRRRVQYICLYVTKVVSFSGMHDNYSHYTYEI